MIAPALSRFLNGRLVVPTAAANGFMDAFEPRAGRRVRVDFLPTLSAESSAAPGWKLVDAGGLLTLVAHQNLLQS
jgi:hypothetical protein